MIRYSGSVEYRDEHGNLNKRTPTTHPYDYEGFVVAETDDPDLYANNTVYTDRLMARESEKYTRLRKKHVGDSGCSWHLVPLDKIEAFLKEWLGDLTLVRVMEYCSPATGYPTWRLDYYQEE
jgi:hypothetical protein